MTQRAILRPRSANLRRRHRCRFSPEVVAGEGLVLDRVATDRLLVDPVRLRTSGTTRTPDGREDPDAQSRRRWAFHSVDPTAATFKVGQYDAEDRSPPNVTNVGEQSLATDDPMLMAYEVWNKTDNNIYTLVEA